MLEDIPDVQPLVIGAILVWCEVRGRWPGGQRIEGQAHDRRKLGVKRRLTGRPSVVLRARRVPPKRRMRAVEGCGHLC